MCMHSNWNSIVDLHKFFFLFEIGVFCYLWRVGRIRIYWNIGIANQQDCFLPQQSRIVIWAPHWFFNWIPVRFSIGSQKQYDYENPEIKSTALNRYLISSAALSTSNRQTKSTKTKDEKEIIIAREWNNYKRDTVFISCSI